MEFVRWHHIGSDLYSIFSKTAHSLTNEQLRELQMLAMQVRLDNLKKLQIQKKLSSSLVSAGVRHLYFKGLILSEWLYSQYDLRECGDIDLIVHPDDYDLATEVLEKAGIHQIYPSKKLSSFSMKRYKSAMKDMTFEDEKTEIQVELHWRLRESDRFFDFDFDQEYRQRRNFIIDGYDFPAFCNQTHVRYLAMHGSLSYWARLRWLLDWHRLCEKEMDWSSMYQIAFKRKEHSYIDLAFLLSSPVMSTPVPNNLNIKNSYKRRLWQKSILKGMQLNTYRNWLLRKHLMHIAFNDLSKSLSDVHAMVRKIFAFDTL